MKIVVLSPVRLLGDCLATCFTQNPDFTILAVVTDLSSLRNAIVQAEVDLVLIDVTQGIDLYDVRSIAAARPDVALVALGLTEHRQDVIRCGRAGFSGYVGRDATVEALCKALSDIIEGRLACPADISCSLLRALFRLDVRADEPDSKATLTRRESDVLQLIGQGLSNKEIARELVLSIATVKHHVHHILAKLNVGGRMHAMRRVRDAPWIAANDPIARKRSVR